MAAPGLRNLPSSFRTIKHFLPWMKQLDVVSTDRSLLKLLKGGILPSQMTGVSLISTNAPQKDTADAQPVTQHKSHDTIQLKGIHIDHFGKRGSTRGSEEYRMPHPVWSEEDVHKVEVTHEKPAKFVDKLAYKSVKALRGGYDILSLYHFVELDENRWLNRIIMLETIAGVPGMIAAMTRHFHALRRLKRDNGWIHTLLEEAENERIHLMTALELKQPGIIFRGAILFAQGVFVNLFFLAYLISPKFCHRFVGYLEEEAVKTYTHCLECIDSGKLPLWKNQLAPKIAINYWQLPQGSTMRDVILAIRADEAHHRVVNHTLSTLPLCSPNPFLPGEKKL
ncbi:uncharacterized protein [Acropora muricata]|uniref:uncharacterized protein n=1 Tax=Acropora muricata TaxID=159855 RepID=UPI0010FCC82F